MLYQKPVIMEYGSSKMLIEAGPGTTRDQGTPAPGMGYYGKPGATISIVTVVGVVVSIIAAIFSFAW